MVDHLLQAIPPLAVYLVVGLLLLTESLGIPLPGEIILVSAALRRKARRLARPPDRPAETVREPSRS